MNMTVKIYVDWDSQEIYTEEEKQDWIGDCARDKMHEDDVIEEFLTYEKDFSIADIWGLTDQQKEGLNEELFDYCIQGAEFEFGEATEEREFEV